MLKREATVKRKTNETNVSVHLNIDGTGKYESSFNRKDEEMWLYKQLIRAYYNGYKHRVDDEKNKNRPT